MWPRPSAEYQLLRIYQYKNGGQGHTLQFDSFSINLLNSQNLFYNCKYLRRFKLT